MKGQIEGQFLARGFNGKTKKLWHSVLTVMKLICSDIYVDGADEINHQMQMIKGGGAALTREKLLQRWQNLVCIVDESKQVDVLVNSRPLKLSQWPALVARELVKLGGLPEYRENVVTDNGNGS